MYERFDELRRILGFSVSDICRETGIAKSTMSDWKKGKFKLKEDKRKLIAKMFGVTLAVLDGEEPIPVELFSTFISPVPKPAFDLSAGDGRVNGEYADEFIDTNRDTDNYSYCTIHGDSMYPILHDGDMVKVKIQTTTTPQDITVVKVDGETVTAKYVEIVSDGVWLRAENKEVFEDKFYSVMEVMTLPVTIIGKVVELTRLL